MRARCLVVLAALAAASPRAARAGGALAELTFGGVPASADAPGSYWLANKLGGVWDVTGAWQVRGSLATTRPYGGDGETSSGDVRLASLGASYAPDDHWTLHANAGWSPESFTQALVDIDPAGVFAGASQATADIHATSSSMSFGAGVDYDADSDGEHDVSVSLSATITYFSSEQEITAVRDDLGDTADPQQVRSACAQYGCDADLAAAATPQWEQLGQFAFAASLCDTIDSTTDLALDATYFVYDQDPLRLGYFALATLGRSDLASATGVAALRDSIAPSVAHRWKKLAISLSSSYGAYEGDRGWDFSTSVRLQYKLGLGGHRNLKLFGTAARVWHVDDSAPVTRSGSVGMGLQVGW